MRYVLAFVVALLVAAGAVFVWAGRAAGPSIEIREPSKAVGMSTPLDVVVTAPRGNLSRLDVAIEQNGQQYPLFGLAAAGTAAQGGASLKQEAEDKVRVTGAVGRKNVAALRGGPARIVVTAERPVMFGLRRVRSQAARDVVVFLEPPRVSVVSVHHFVNHGGAEVVVYRATPPEVESGVRVGDVTYPGFPAAGAGIPANDPALKVAFFALLWDQDLNAPISVFARDTAGNEGRATFEYRVFPKPFKKSRIEINDTFLQRVVPGILEHTPDLKVENPSDLVSSFLTINGTLRKRNAEAIAALAKDTSPKMLWEGPFAQLTNSQVEASFADQRTYFYAGKEIDRQVHLGFDLAVTANVAVAAANKGTVVYADFLGIYGNTVVVDHGMGLQSLYAHLSSIEVKPGDTVQRGQTVGRSGMTGLAGGDHLHFTMLLNGHPVTPVDWWSQQWVEDRVLRKFREAGAPAPAAQTAAPAATPEPAKTAPPAKARRAPRKR
jgi:murein DD-endopeptidase MepM/ murein hydrolase activator NlpD